MFRSDVLNRCNAALRAASARTYAEIVDGADRAAWSSRNVEPEELQDRIKDKGLMADILHRLELRSRLCAASAGGAAGGVRQEKPRRLPGAQPRRQRQAARRLSQAQESRALMGGVIELRTPETGRPSFARPPLGKGRAICDSLSSPCRI
ncbi:MAG: hypothetical protein ACN6I7_01565 [bacterium]